MDGRQEVIRCKCGCHIITIDKFDDDYWVMLWEHGYNKMSLWQRMKTALNMLLGKKYYLFDILLNKEQAERLKNILP